MDDLIKGLSVLRKYLKADPHNPTHCEHDILMVVGIEKDVVSEEDATTLDSLGFFWSDDYDCWASFRFGSA